MISTAANRTRAFLPFCLLLSVFCLSSCTPKVPALPTGAGTPFPEFAAAYQQATAACRDVRTYTAVMALSGKAGGTKLRGRIEAGFAAPASLRLEGIAPFGKPVFVLTATDGRGTLVLPREDQVLQDAPPEAIVEALAGVSLDPDTLRLVVAGCGLWRNEGPTDGRGYGATQAALVFPDGTAYLRRAGDSWQLAAASRGTLTVYYSDVASARPSTIRLRAASGGQTTADIMLRLSQVDINTAIDPRAFTPNLPSHPVPITLDELRRAGPLGTTDR